MRCGEASQPLGLYSSAIYQDVLSQAVLQGSTVSPQAWYTDDAIITEADVSLVQKLSLSIVKSDSRNDHDDC